MHAPVMPRWRDREGGERCRNEQPKARKPAAAGHVIANWKVLGSIIPPPGPSTDHSPQVALDTGWIGIRHPSRRSLRDLLRVRILFNAIKARPHAGTKPIYIDLVF